VFPEEIHWVVTSAWTYPDWLRSNTITPISRWLFKKVARVYGFTSMPPMPPNPRDILARAEAVRHILKFAHQAENPVIGLAPEGGDFAGSGELAKPPSGLGRFVHLLCERCPRIVPVAIFEWGGKLILNIGKPYRIEKMTTLPAIERDRLVSDQVMQHLSELLPGKPDAKIA
jgi:hypothetical protein